MLPHADNFTHDPIPGSIAVLDGVFVMKMLARLVCILLFVPAVCVFAQEDLSPYAWSILPRVWGANVSIAVRLAEVLPHWPLRVWVAGGGAYEDAFLYRSFQPGDNVGSHTNPLASHNTAAYKSLNFQGALGLSQDFAFGIDVVRAFVLVKTRYEYHDPAWAPDAGLFGSDLADRERLLENALLIALAAERQIPLERIMEVFPITYGVEICVHLAPSLFLNEVADYTRFSVSGRLLFQLLNALSVQAYFATRLGYDRMWGAAYPAWARAAVGRIDSPYFTHEAALGGVVRGLASGRFDGTTKLYLNNDLRLHLPVHDLFSPAVTVFFDAGVADYKQLDHRIGVVDLLYTTGIQIALSVAGTEVGYRAACALNEPDPQRRFSHGITFGAHF